MITADEIKCEIGSEAAIKGAELFCSVANKVNSADSQTWATWAGACATFLAVIAAGLAWLEARAANEATDRNLSIQLKEQRALTLHQMELEKLARFSEVLVWFVNNTLVQSESVIADLKSNDRVREEAARKVAEDDYRDRCRELVSSWMTWSMFLIATDDDLREATNSFLEQTKTTAKEVLQMQLESCTDWGHGNQFAGQLQETLYEEKLDTLIFNIGSTLANIQFIRQQGDDWEKLRHHVIELYPKIP